MATAPKKHKDSKLLTAAFSAVLCKELMDDDSNLARAEKLSVFDHHKTTYSYGPTGDVDVATKSNDNIQLFIKPLKGAITTCELPSTATIVDLRNYIQQHMTISTDHQRLVHGGKQLEDGKTLSDYGILYGSTVHLIACVNNTDPIVLDPATLDPLHDYDFTTINDDNQTFARGGEKYVRPCGYKRYALNVTHQYKDLQWLSCNNSPGEWPVSYHGTGESDNKTLAQSGQPATKGNQLRFTHGIYTTPDVKLAEAYGKKFQYNGEDYLIIFQNRVNPQNLVKVSRGSEKYWINPSEEDVRPYGICIRKIIK